MSELIKRDHDFVWHPFSPFLGMPELLAVERGEGAHLITNDGRRIIDAVSSWWVNLHGHGNNHIADAIALQAKKLEQVIFAGFTHQPAVDLSEKLLQILPKNQSKVFFSDDGSTAIEVALKLCFQYWFNHGEEKKKIIAFEGAYHGDTFGAMSVGSRDVFVKPFNPYLFDVVFLPLPDQENSSFVKKTFKDWCETGKIGGFIFEPLVQGAAGMRVYEAAILDDLLSIAKSHHVISIADEVMTGFGRLGRNFASDFLQNNPDIICLSKGLTGGFMPMGVTTVSKEIVQAFWTDDARRSFLHGHSYTGNPLACAAALASLQILQSAECQQNIERITQLHHKFSLKLQGHQAIADIRSLGTILAIELNSSEETGYFNKTRHYIYDFFLTRNILLRPLGNVLYVLPPYVITDHDLERVYSCIEEFLRDIINL